MSDDTDMPQGILKRAGRGPNARHRAPVREEPVREAARAPEGEKRLQRKRKRSEDRFYLPDHVLKDMKARGMSYEWKRESSYGMPDTNHMMNLQDNHWQPVPENRYPGMITKQDGMVLMERPAYLTQDARKEDYEIAVGQVRDVGAKIAETPDGTMTRDHPSARANTRLTRSYEPMPIPED